MEWLLSLLAASLLLTAGCDSTEQSVARFRQPAEQTPRRVPDQDYLDQALPKLRTVKLWLGANELISETARSRTEIATGMMYRTKMAENEAMIFVFPRPFRASFYMRNTVLPLSCAYIDRDGTILEIHDMKPLDETPIVASTDQVRYVLEVNQGWFDRHGVKIGTVVTTEKGSLDQIFFGR
ncbi:MAG: hypothetical protein M2R45_04759 [Verrucomicrobia subdivision 3 bacterium]|nr:hypothetical protein [Limisphaerales bacterium]MCS1415088.1 hypothetical protein [Limisphaerales bacterium]